MKPSHSSIPSCRLCGAATALHAVQTVLGRHQVCYWRCPQCDLIQTDAPHWLEEAYASAMSRFDTGAIRRNLLCASMTRCVAFASGLPAGAPCLDFGGGHGVFVRHMRDLGFDFRLCDAHAGNLFARGFEASPQAPCGLLTAFEVLEHFVDVRAEIEGLFRAGRERLLVSTQLHRRQTPPWWYFMPESGQHVAFYGRPTMRWIGERFGYEVFAGSAYTLFLARSLRLPAWRRALLRRLVQRTRGDRESRWTRWIGALAPRRAPLTESDCHDLLRRAA